MTLLDRALNLAAIAHAGQLRKGSEVPYIVHPVGVALILLQAGFGEEVVASAILHDVVEDTDFRLEQIQVDFGPHIAEWVGWMTEVKNGPDGRKLPWKVRKQEHFERLTKAPLAARAIALADKLNNLRSIQDDLRNGLPIWERFNADRDEWLKNAHRVVINLAKDDDRLRELSSESLKIIEELSAGSDLP